MTEPERSPLVHALFERLRLPPAVAAQVDWGSGVLLVNRGMAQWQQFFKDPKADPPLLTTLEHEAHHIVQISTLTYLYRFAVAIHTLAASILDQHYNNLSSLPETLGDRADAVKNLVWDLNWRDSDGLSVIDIVESLTYFSQVNAVAQLSHLAYLEHVRRPRVGDKYRRGYEVFDVYTRGVADPSPFFPIICHLSLCSWEPRTCFAGLSKALAAGRIANDISLKDLLAICQELEPKFPGFAWEIQSALPQLGIRFTFTEFQNTLTADAGMMQNLWQYLLQPHVHSMTFFGTALGMTPAILNPVSDADASDFRKWFVDMRGIRSFGRFTLDQRRFWLLYLAAVSRKYVEPIGTPPEGSIRQTVR